MLGLNRIKSVSVGIAVNVHAHPSPTLLNVRHLWEHSLSIALAIAVRWRAQCPSAPALPTTQVFFAGLLHDIEKFHGPQLSRPDKH